MHGAPSFVLANKLKLLKGDLKKWNVEVFGNVEEWGKQFWKDLSVLETIEDSRGLIGGKAGVGKDPRRVRESFSFGRNLLETEI